LENLDVCFKKEVEKSTTTSKESSFCKPLVEDDTVIDPSFAIDEAEKKINNPVNITLQDSMNHLIAETPLLLRNLHRKRCTQFFQNHRPTPPREEDPRPLLQPTPSPCEGDRTPCMAQLYSQMAGEQKKVSPIVSGLKEENDRKSITTEQDLALEKSIWNCGEPKAFSFGCLTPAMQGQGRSPVNCSPVLGFTFDSPLSPLPLRVEQRSNDSDPTPPTAKRRLKKRFSSLRKRREPGSPMDYDEEYSRSLKKRKLSPIVHTMGRKSPVNSPACSGIYSKSSLLSSGKKLFLHTPLKCSFSPENMMNSPLELTRC